MSNASSKKTAKVKVPKALQPIVEPKDAPKKRWGPVSAILVTLGIYFGAQFIGLLLVAMYADIRHLDLQNLLDESVGALFIYLLLVQFFSVLLLWQFLASRGVSREDIGLKRPTLGNIAYAIPTYGIYFILLIITIGIADKLIPKLNVDQQQQVGFQTANSFSSYILVFIGLAILPPIVEEIMVRGFLYGGLKQKLPKVTAALIASVVFGAAHLQFGSGKPLLWVAAIDTFLLSLVLIWLREKTGNIYAGMAVHFIKNTLAFFAVFIFTTS